MKFRYQLTAHIGVRDNITNNVLIPHEQFVLLYDSPEELNFLNPIHQALAKQVARICFENNLLEQDRLKELCTAEPRTEILLIDQEYIKQVRRKEEEL